MPWPIHYHEQEPDSPQPGDMWPVPGWLEVPGLRNLIAPEYFQRWHGRRPPLIVRLPNGDDFCIDSKPSVGGSGWDVTGEPPNITTSPSIASNNWSREHGYHGFLTSGVLSDDVEGRTFPN